MGIKIRKAVKSDVKSIMNLIQALADFENESDAVEITEEELLRDGFKENALFDVLLAEVADKVVGMAFYYFRYSTWKGKSIHLEDLIVFEEYRKQKVGTALYTAFLEEAKKEEVRRVEWAVLDWNTPARDFYKSSGATILSEWEVVQMDRQAVLNYLKKA